MSFLKLQERKKKKSLCAVKHANSAAGKDRQLGIPGFHLLLTHAISSSISLLALCFSHSSRIVMAEGFRQDVMV